MAYISLSKNREGKHYVYLKESFRKGNKTSTRILEKYGCLEELEKDEPTVLERLREEAKFYNKNEVDIKIDLQKKISNDHYNYGWKVLDRVYQSLGITQVVKQYEKSKKFDFDLDDLIKLLVFQRIQNPDSKTATLLSQKNMFGDWNTSHNQMFRGLDYINELKDSIQKAMHDNVSTKIGRKSDLVFYDVTNYYFEIDYNDEDTVDIKGNIIEQGMRKKGPSKEKRPKPIVQMGMFLDSNSIPISYKLFPGNNTDPITYRPAIEQVKEQFGVQRIITVADKAMNSKANVLDAFKRGDGWIFSSKLRGRTGAPKDIQQFALGDDDWEYNEEGNFAKKTFLRNRLLDNGIKVREKVIVTWNQKYANREKKRRNGALVYAQGLTQPEKYRKSCKMGGKKYLLQMIDDIETGEKKKLTPFIDIDWDRIAEEEKFDGMNVLVTSEIDMDDAEVIEYYGQLFKIEDCFRVTKTEFSSRPVYVSTSEHIEAHFLTCFISLVLIKVLQSELKNKVKQTDMTSNVQSVEKIVAAINSASTYEVGKGYWKVFGNDDFLELNSLLGVEWNRSFVSYEKLNSYFKKVGVH